ncbi:TPA: cytochrome b [Legionella pneumophila]|uniref:Cytochrome b n=2 Tax=Legionella TaxID=445 RepID=A0AAN5Q240_LEGPN|nr:MULTISPECIES: cytochrome b [Legionella]KTD59729.1 cytochrome B561 [Legionella sainthelensi]RYX49035.1 cytochrome b [Legionella pneumophila]VEH31769.1 cytochrome B561 [Legionella sainthelensi]HAT1864028.1 cytochrome b [Legionella pneumophila]HAT7747165.1 cytochrome b [Legionella pneumophila]
MENNKNWHYDTITRLLHWVIAFLLIGLISIGWYMMSIEDQPYSGWYFNLHKSFGLIAAMLIFFRLIWRFTHKPAPLPSSVPHWQAILSRAIHLLLYLCMLIMPITGFIGASYSKHGVIFFGVELPSWVNKSHAISEQFFEVHEVVAWTLVVLIALHILAAMKHLVINKDKVFQRMWL